MANFIVKKQLNFIVKNANLTDIYEIDRVRYGLEVFFNETTKLIVMFLIALLLDKVFAFFLTLSLLLLIRPHIGGSHSKSLMSCLIKSNIVFISIYYLANIIPPINKWIHLIILILAAIPILIFKPVNPLRKKINTSYGKIKFKFIVCCTLLLWYILSSLFLSNYYLNCGLLIIIYVILDFLKEVYKNEKKQSI